MGHPPAFHAPKRAANLFLISLGTVLALAACSPSGKEPAAKGPAAGAQQALPVQTLQVQPTRVPLTIEAIGQTEGVREVEVRARVSGILEKRLYAEGTPVKAGQVLFQIERAPYEIALSQARAQLAEQKARAEQATREAERLQGLLDKQAISRKEYDDAVSTRAVAHAAVLGAEAAVRDAERNLSYTAVTAPVAGTSGRAQHSEGALVSAGSDGLLTTIVQLNPIRVRFSLAESDLAKFPGGRPNAARKVEMVLPDGSVYPQPGKLDFASSRVDPTLGTLELRAEFPNPKGDILPGQFVRARVTADERENAFLVPQGAVVQSDKGTLVMLMGADGKVQPRPVTAAEWRGSDWVITGGLAAGDKVIVDNLMKLRPGMQVAEKPAAPAPGAPAAAQADAKPKS